MAGRKTPRHAGPPGPEGGREGAVRGGKTGRRSDSLSDFQRAAGNLAVQRRLRPDAQELSHTGLSIQRAPEEGSATPTQEPEAAAQGLIVDDAIVDLGPGQMRRSEFLAQVRDAVCRAAEESLAGSLWSATGCPYIEQWLGYYAGQDASHIERAVHLYAAETRGLANAAEYLPAIAARVRTGVAAWRATGELPAGIPAGEAPGGIVSGMASAASSFVGGLFFKRRGDGPDTPGSPRGVRARLGKGNPLDAGIRGRMESNFGTSFSGVRVHTDSQAAGLASNLRARAFTVGRDVAFGSGEYRPGTPIGDALIAHELAHVVQQRGAMEAGVLPGGPAYETLEEEADASAIGAVTGIRSGLHGVMPRLRSGLRLQRCSKDAKVPGAPITKVVGHGASASAVKMGQERMDEVIGSLKSPATGDLKDSTIELHIIPHDKKLTDLPEFAHLKGTRTFDGRLYDDLRGVGGIKTGNIIRYAVAEEELVAVSGKPTGYSLGFVAGHETGHLVEQFGLTADQKKTLTDAFNARTAAGGPWLNPGWYTSSSTSEYFAQSTSAYFGRPYSNDPADQTMYTRDWLKTNDPDMYKLITEVYK